MGIMSVVYNRAMVALLQVEEHHYKGILSVMYNRVIEVVPF